MNIEFNDIMNGIGILIGGGGLGWLISWKFARRKEAAEAATAETAATKEVQDVYQQLIADVKNDRNDQREYIAELKEDRAQLRENNDKLRERIDKTDAQVRKLEEAVARNGRMVEALRPFLCNDLKCTKRKAMGLKGLKA